MKFAKIFLITLFFLPICALSVKAQIPNASFESWDNGSITGWWTDDVPPTILPVTKSSDAESGSFAVKGEVIAFNSTNFPPLLLVGSSQTNAGFSVSQRYLTLNGYYKFSSNGGDRLAITVVMYKNGSAIGEGIAYPSESSGYQQFSANITYNSSGVPDQCQLEVAIASAQNSSGVHPGSVFYVDNFSFGSITAIDNHNTTPQKFSISQNYPNPFNPTTNIKYSLPVGGFVRVTLYNLLGEKVATIVNQKQTAGFHKVVADLNSYASGMYLYKINVTGENGQDYSAVKKMILMK